MTYVNEASCVHSVAVGFACVDVSRGQGPEDRGDPILLDEKITNTIRFQN